jgi:hypothetical protein
VAMHPKLYKLNMNSAMTDEITTRGYTCSVALAKRWLQHSGTSVTVYPMDTLDVNTRPPYNDQPYKEPKGTTYRRSEELD